MHTGVPMLRRWLHTIFAARHTKKASVFLLFLVAVGLFLWINPVFAETYDQFKNSILGAMSEFFLGVSSFFIQLTLFCLKFFILIAGYNGFIDADVVKFGWNIVRDVANMFFVVILLVIAFGTILGLEQYEWRKSMVKLVFAAIFVNFSNVICQLIIDVAQVFTITFLNAVAGTAAGNLIQMLSLQSVFQLVRNGSAPGSESLPVVIVVSSLFALFFSVMAAVSIGSYMIVMLYRMVVLWCLIILSPLAFIFSILPTTKGYADEFWKEFTNHVIAAPVMVFFLWLAFSTFGGGNVVQNHIQQHSLPGMTISEPGEELGLTASAASSFGNLANFAVAVAFLLMGLERVQKLGVKGGDYVQRGMDFGKKVFGYASGYVLGRAAYEKAGVPGAKFVANKFPAIGGDAWRRRGKSIKGWAKIKGAGIDTARDNLAGKLEGKGLGLGTALSWVVQSGARADKIAGAWEKAGEDARKVWDERVSTSKTAAGQAKLDQGVKLEIAQELAGDKKKLKFAEHRDKLIKGGGAFKEMDDEIAKTRARAGLVTSKLDAETEKAVEEEKRKLFKPEELAKMSGKEKDDYEKAQKKYGAFAGEFVSAKAEAEQLKKESTEGGEIAIAKARDEWLINNGRASEALFERNVYAKLAKEATERQSVGDIDLARVRVKQQVDRLKSAVTPQQREQAQKALSDMVAANMGLGAAFGDMAKDIVLDEIGANKASSMVVDRDSIADRQAQWLSAKLGQEVKRADLASKFQEWKDTFGSDERAQAALEQELLNLNNMAGQGSVGNAGLLIREIDSTGNISVRLADGGNTKDREHIQARRTNALSSAKITSISGLSGSADRNAAGEAIVQSAEAKEVLSDMISRLTSNMLSSVDAWTIDDLAKIAEKSTEADLQDLITQIKAKSRDTKAIKGLFKQVESKVTDASRKAFLASNV